MATEVKDAVGGNSFCVANVSFVDVENQKMSNVVSDRGSQEIDLTVNPEQNRFPYSIVWGPLPCLSWCFPCIGHMGIGDSVGRIHDFAGPYTVNKDMFMVGPVVRYYQLSKKHIEKLEADGGTSWDDAINDADREYKKLVHNLCCQNCHHHSAKAARNAGWNVGFVHAAMLVICQGRCVSLSRTLCAYGPFLLIVLVVVLVVVLSG